VSLFVSLAVWVSGCRADYISPLRRLRHKRRHNHKHSFLGRREAGHHPEMNITDAIGIEWGVACIHSGDLPRRGQDTAIVQGDGVGRTIYKLSHDLLLLSLRPNCLNSITGKRETTSRIQFASVSTDFINICGYKKTKGRVAVPSP
jgi:hypothetical protein